MTNLAISYVIFLQEFDVVARYIHSEINIQIRPAFTFPDTDGLFSTLQQSD